MRGKFTYVLLHQFRGWAVLDLLSALSLLLVLAHPYRNVFTIPRAYALLLLLVLLVGRVLLNRCRYNSFVGIGNLLVFGACTVFLFSFSDPKYFSMLYVVTVGNALNFVALLFNGGRVPGETSGLFQRDRELLPDNPLHVTASQHSRMRILDDRIYAALLSNKIISIGDIVLYVGFIATAVHVYLF